MRRPSERVEALLQVNRAGGPAGRRFVAWRGVVIAAAFAVLAGTAIPGSAQNAPRVASEEGVKAAYLYKFPAYVDWPPDAFERPDSAVVIAVVEHERLFDALVAITSERRVGGRPIQVRRLSADDSLAGVHIMFLARRDRDRSGAGAEPRTAEQPTEEQPTEEQPTEEQRTAEQPTAGQSTVGQSTVGQSTAAQPILTVADADDAPPEIVLTFVSVDGRVRFEVDLDEAQRRGLRLHSGLLAVAERVHGARR